MGDSIVFIMAGGKGSRLAPLTCHRAKPATPFGGRYRILDFVLSSFVNSGYQQIFILTQYMASSLIRHVNRYWPSAAFGTSVEVVPAQMRTGQRWYEGTADAVYQNLNLVQDAHAEHVAVFGGDHVYLVNAEQMEEFHRDHGADLTVATFPVPREEAHAFGVVEVDAQGRIVGFAEKPKDPKTIPGRPDTCLVSMGNYFFPGTVLEQVLREDALDRESAHDFGKSVIPRMVREGYRVQAWDFGENRIPGDDLTRPYWRDVGTIDSYFTANMELRSPVPALNLYNRRWPIRSANRNYPPARFVMQADRPASHAIDSLVCEGTILNSARVGSCVISYDCFLHAGSHVTDSMILSGCDIGAGARLHRVVMDKNCSVAPGAVVGLDAAVDRERFPFVSESGIVVLPKGTHVPEKGPVELAQDMYLILQNDPDTSGVMAERAHTYSLGRETRHSDDSVGPRFQKYGRG